MKFDLVKEPWIPCYDLHGGFLELGLLEVFRRAHELREVRDQSPLVTAALHRLLLAVHHRSVDGPRNRSEWMTLWRAGRIASKKTEAYLHSWRPRFDLFDDEHPFFQVGGMDQDARVPVGKLRQEAASGNNPTLFDHSRDDEPVAMTPAQAACSVVALQAYAVGGGKSGKSNVFGAHPNYTHAPGLLGSMVLLTGRSLFETLMLNTLVLGKEAPIPMMGSDSPVWERDLRLERPEERLCRGWLDLLTWPSRCVRLLPEATGGVRWCYLSQGASIKGDVREPMAFFKPGKKPGERFAVRLDKERALWRDSDSLFALKDAEGVQVRQWRPLAFEQIHNLIEDDDMDRAAAPRTCVVFGLANDKAKVLRWASDELPVTRELLTEPKVSAAVVAAVDFANQAWAALQSVLWRLAQEYLTYVPGGGGRNADKDVVSAVRRSFQADLHYWGSLDVPFRGFLLEASSKPEEATLEWRERILGVANEAFRKSTEGTIGVSPRALRARALAEGSLRADLSALRK